MGLADYVLRSNVCFGLFDFTTIYFTPKLCIAPVLVICMTVFDCVFVREKNQKVDTPNT